MRQITRSGTADRPEGAGRISAAGGNWDVYAPLRMLVCGDSHGSALFTMDQPGPAFGSLGIDEAARIGAELDRKVVKLLRVIGVDAEQAFA